MNKSLFVYVPVALVGWFAALAPARAQSELPPDRSVFFNIHADIENPESPVTIATEVRLTALDRDGDVVGWYPLWIAITQFDEQGEFVESWTHLDPSLAQDRLWYVTHADPAAPKAAEFTNPPELSGTADADTPNGPTLDYYILGKNQGTPPVTPYPITSIIDYSFQRSDEAEPIDDDEDEPVDTPPAPDET